MAETASRLRNELKALSREPWTNTELIDANIHKWSVALMPMNKDSLYYGGYFKATMTFPSNYPYSPPDFRFNNPLWHPNVYSDGRLCISILHPPGDDEMSGELASERWSPAQSVESVLLSILSLLDDPETSSPANVDASVQYRNDRDGFKLRTKQDVERSLIDKPEGFVIPTEDAYKAQKEEEILMSWEDSDEEDDFDFGSDAEMTEGDLPDSGTEDEDEDEEQDEE